MRIYQTLMLAVLLCCTLPAFAIQSGIIPAPAKAEAAQGCFTFGSGTMISVQNAQMMPEALLLASHFASQGFVPAVVTGCDEADVVMAIDDALPAEGYKLSIADSKIAIAAADRAGLFYAVQSLRQLITPQLQVPGMVIEDYPRFGYRGLMLDVSRYFLPRSEMLKIIDAAAMLKINKLHLHLVDDNGWRIEIKRYPRLMQVGAWRVERSQPFPSRPNQQPGEQASVGGYYTHDDIKEIVAHAAARHIEVIPEIEMPAHTNSSLAAYPGLACPSVDDDITVLPGGGGRNAKYIYCAGNDSVFSFLQNVLDEVMELFPSRYIHLGGDEAVKSFWASCPRCQQRMEAEGLASLDDLQGYFMERMSDYVRSKGRIPMGWDELTGHQLPDSVVIYGWRGYGDAATRAAAQGHRFVLTPARVLYFIRYQGPQWFEPYTYFGNITLKDVYEYEPIKPQWPAQYADLLMGLQASMWTEFCTSPAQVQYQIFPRLLAAAEVAWSQPGSKDWPDFVRRVDSFVPRLQAMGIVWARSMYNIDHRLTPADGRVQVELSCIRPDVEIRYTTDGSNPTSQSNAYNRTIELRETSVVKAATFIGGEQQGQVLTLPVTFNKATGCKVTCDAANGHLLTNGLRGSDRHSDFEWVGWHDTDGSFVIDLGKRTRLRRVTLGCITNSGMAVHIPRQLRLSVSSDGHDYTTLASMAHSHEHIFASRTAIEDAIFDGLNASGRYLKVEFDNPGKCPEGDLREGQATWVYFDEIIVE